MDDLKRVVSDVLAILIRVGGAILSAGEAIEVSVREQLAAMGASPLTQTMVLVVLAFAIILLALRIFGGLLRLAVVVILVLIALQVIMPTLMLPTH